MDELIKHVQTYLVEAGLARVPGAAVATPRPWLPPAFQHPPQGAIAPGDQAEAGAPDAMRDDGLVLNIMDGVGIPPMAGAEDRRIDCVEFIIRCTEPPAAKQLEAQLRWHFLLGPQPQPGGRVDWVMAGLYVIQSTQQAPMQPLSPGTTDVFSYMASYLIETRAIDAP